MVDNTHNSDMQAHIKMAEALFLDEHGLFKNELNLSRSGSEILYCNNCRHFQHDIHRKFWCRKFKRTQGFIDIGCKRWVHWEVHR